MRIDVQGVEHVVLVDGDGMFRVIVDGQLYTADTLADLRSKVRVATHRPEVHVPFSTAVGGHVRHGVADDIRKSDGSVVALWEDMGRHAAIDWDMVTLRHLDEAEATAYQKLLTALEDARGAVAQFERPLRINLKFELLKAQRSWEAGDLG
jgi:hypothetical protein